VNEELKWFSGRVFISSIIINRYIWHITPSPNPHFHKPTNHV